jgi:hypothetical protein
MPKCAINFLTLTSKVRLLIFIKAKSAGRKICDFHFIRKKLCQNSYLNLPRKQFSYSHLMSEDFQKTYLLMDFRFLILDIHFLLLYIFTTLSN